MAILDKFTIKILSKMLLIKITNSSDVVASKAGKIFEKITPDKIDVDLVESQVIKRMCEDLVVEGLKGEISIVNGIDIENDHLVINKDFIVKRKKTF